MALTKEQKQEVVKETAELLAGSKMTVVAKYEGTGVKPMQQLRRDASATGTTVKVVKNRLVRQALSQTDKLKDVDASGLTGMLLYAFNGEDEVAGAQTLATFAKKNPTVEFVGAISAEGKLLNAAEVKELSQLPGKDQLVAQVVANLLSPVNDVVGAAGGNLHGLLDAVAAKAA